MTDAIMSFQQPTHVADVLVTISPEYTIDEVLAAPGARACALFLRLTRLSIEDERLADILKDYTIEITHGDKKIWPPQPQRDYGAVVSGFSIIS